MRHLTIKNTETGNPIKDYQFFFYEDKGTIMQQTTIKSRSYYGAYISFRDFFPNVKLWKVMINKLDIPIEKYL